jgi:hypothetical protein
MFDHTEVDPETAGPLPRLVAVASITVSFLATSSAPTPLYATPSKVGRQLRGTPFVRDDPHREVERAPIGRLRELCDSDEIVA